MSQPQSTVVQFVSDSGSLDLNDDTPSPTVSALEQNANLMQFHSNTLERNGDTARLTLKGLRPYTQYRIGVRMLAFGRHSNTTVLTSRYNHNPLEITTSESGTYYIIEGEIRIRFE